MNYNKNTCHYENNREMKDKDFINSPPKALRAEFPILSALFKKDVPNVDFPCEPESDTCWCKEIEYELPIPKRGICYSPREMKQLQIEISEKLGSYIIDGC